MAGSKYRPCGLVGYGISLTFVDEASEKVLSSILSMVIESFLQFLWGPPDTISGTRRFESFLLNLDRCLRG